MRISGSSSDVCSSDLSALVRYGDQRDAPAAREVARCRGAALHERVRPDDGLAHDGNLMIGAFAGEPFRQLAPAPAHGLVWQRVVEGKSVTVRVDLGGRRMIEKYKKNHQMLFRL